MDNKQQQNPLTEHPIVGGVPPMPVTVGTPSKPVNAPAAPAAPAQPMAPIKPVAPVAPTKPTVSPQPIPSSTIPRKELEQKAKAMVKELNRISPTKETQLPKRSPKIAALIVVLLLLAGGGGFAGMRLLQTPGSQEDRSQAASESCSPVGSTSCQQDANGKYNGWLCTCNDVPTVGQVWQCKTRDTNTCPVGGSAGGGGGSGGGGGGGSLPNFVKCSDDAKYKTCVPDHSACYTVNGQACMYYIGDCADAAPRRCPNDQCSVDACRAAVRGECEANGGTGTTNAIVANCMYFCTNWTNCETGTKDCNNVSCGGGPTNPPEMPTLTPSPVPVLACTTIGYSKNSPNFGDTVTLTCTGSPNADVGYAYFQVKKPGGQFADITNATSTTATFIVDTVGHYETRCRVCKSQDIATCTDWQGTTGN